MITPLPQSFRTANNSLRNRVKPLNSLAIRRLPLQEGKAISALLQNAAAELLQSGFSLRAGRKMMEVALIEEAMKRSGNNRCKAAKLLRVHRNTISRKSSKKYPVPDSVKRRAYKPVPVVRQEDWQQP